MYKLFCCLAQDVVSDSMDRKEDVVENILRGLTSQIAEREDAILCSDVRNKLFGPMEFSRRDLASLNIMRGRDNGLPDYNTVLYFPIEILFKLQTSRRVTSHSKPNTLK